MRVGVVINQEARGTRDVAVAREVRAEFAGHGIEATVMVRPGRELVAAARGLLAEVVDTLVAGGGDGTVSSVAEICVREKVRLGILPLGTRNHFCRDLGLPRSTRESIACIATGVTRRVDVGSVNGRIFINNSSVGAYPRAVEEREGLRERFGLRKHVAGVIATLRTFARRPVMDAEIEVDGRTFPRSSPFVFVGNNTYSVKLFAVQLRSSLREGKICVYTARCNGVSGFLYLLWLSLWNRLDQSRDFEMRCGSVVTIRLRKDVVRVSKDGEVLRMETPLRYRIHPGALEVFAKDEVK